MYYRVGKTGKNMKIWNFFPTLYYRVGKMKISKENSDKPSSEVVGVWRLEKRQGLERLGRENIT